MTAKTNTTDRELTITRLLNAPIELVWKVFTEPEHIKHFWGPSGFTNTISKMEVKVGGEWEFIMRGPDGTDYENKHTYLEIKKPVRLVMQHVTTPKFITTITLKAEGNKTLLHWSVVLESAEQLQQVIKDVKADQALKQNVEKLNLYLEAQLTLHRQLKTNTMSRTSMYLNFPGNTEQAFNFYKSVFKTKLNGDGFQRFGDIPAAEGHPPLSDADKKLILHVELPILGGHVLMATDAPASMGFTVIQGNNMHINLEPDTRKETKRLFDELSAGGKITMPLEDMFWGAYYGSCTDKFGINWMFNCTEKK